MAVGVALAELVALLIRTGLLANGKIDCMRIDLASDETLVLGMALERAIGIERVVGAGLGGLGLEFRRFGRFSTLTLTLGPADFCFELGFLFPFLACFGMKFWI